MRGHCNRNREGPSQMGVEKQELLKMFVKFLQSDKLEHDLKMRCRGRHGIFGRGFGKHGHGMHHGRHGHHGPLGHRGHHGHHGGPHGFGRPHCNRGSHGPYGPHGRHGPHGSHGRHGPRGCFGHHGHDHMEKRGPHWIIDLTYNETDDVNDPQDNEQNASGSQAQDNDVQGQNDCNECKCSRFERHHRGRLGRWRLSPYKRREMPASAAENSCQTDGNETQDNLTVMVENINIENAAE
ncbi:collagen alpha-1(XXIII) chain-like [Trichoplusia ni]|uniref:Collagen alpha-1(XXIII) chain-like n=1 Tax=Trichoplusia ni TaxID=7111 RepID=A0A7E5VVX5_TRINI|nr:collagen alpha-1(XXIII) chain-like [Trichoplusia ni]